MRRADQHHRQPRRVIAALALLLSAGCRPDPGAGRRAQQGKEAKGGKPASMDAPKGGAAKAALEPAGSDETASLSALEPWFQDRRGQIAVQARSFGQGDRARRLLLKLATDASASPKDRRGAELLLAYDEIRRDEPASAARRIEKIWQLPEFEPVADDLLCMGVRAWLAANRPAMASRLLKKSETSGVASDRVELLRAELAAADGSNRDALARFEALTQVENPAVAHSARVRLASLLIQAGDDQDKDRAKDLLELVEEKHLSSSESRTLGRVRSVLSPEGWPSSQVAQKLARSASVQKVENLYRSRRYRSARRAADKRLRRKKKLGAAELCELYYWKGSSIFRSRDRAGSASSFASGVKSCKQAKNVGMEVKCRFQGARAVFAQGRYAAAANLFAGLAKVHADHSYADDALVFEGEAWESAQEPKKAKAAYLRALNHKPPGDMRPEARRRLMLLAFSQKRLREVVSLVDKSLADQSAGVEKKERAKLLYFRGRARARLGQRKKAIQDYVQVVRTLPLSYAAIHAWSRLRENDPALWREEVSRNLVNAKVEQPPPVILPEHRQARAAILWAQLGLASKAREALRHAGVDGWPQVATLALAGAWFESQRRLAKMPGDWRKQPPTGAMRPHWELAHPMVFKDLVLSREAAVKLPSLLSFAIMQTESRFDPSVTSWAGAKGLMQLMPGTAEFIARKLGIGKPSNAQLHDPDLNIRMGVYNLSSLVGRYGGKEFSAALAIPGYNAGPGNVDKWLDKRAEWDLDLFIEAIPFDETRHYTQSVLGRWLAYRWIYGRGKVEGRIPYLPLYTPKQAAK